MALDYHQGYVRYRNQFKTLRELYQKPIVRTYSLLVLTLLTVSFLGLTAIKPTLTTIAQLIKEIEDKRIVTQQLTKKIESLSQAQIEFQRIRPKLDGLDQAIPKQPAFANLVWEIEYLAAKHQVNLIDFQIGKVVLLGEDKVQNLDNSDQQAVKITLALNLGGEFNNLRQFVNDLENLQRIIQVAEVNFSTDSKKKDETEPLELSLVTEAFYLREGTDDQT
ncbi:type 4a pilus biogenesis protein PilO [Patescibacteria group bacterium]|nr:type 4a pilus biogenesis protein PilO [Patescibacteria group bacterium]MBU1931093.1 type 4a pilus biogenesis protein PilO [Patescibacteria group bacterium]